MAHLAVPSLKQSCVRVLSTHIGAINDVGECTYSLIRPVLVSCTADQLAEIESNSPHIAVESDDLWRVHLERDYPLFDPCTQPSSSSDPAFSSSKSLYFLARSQRAAALTSAAQRLRERTQQNREEKGKRKAVFSETPIVAPTRKRARKGAGANASLMDKARMQTRRIAQAHAASSNGSMVFRKPNTSTPAAGSSSPSSLFSARQPVSSTSGPSKVGSRTEAPPTLTPAPIAQPFTIRTSTVKTPLPTSTSKDVRPVVVRPIMHHKPASASTVASSSSSSTRTDTPSATAGAANVPQRPNTPQPAAATGSGPLRPPSQGSVSLFMPKARTKPPGSATSAGGRPHALPAPTGMRPGVSAWKKR